MARILAGETPTPLAATGKIGTYLLCIELKLTDFG
jgi:hypothetical protein